MPKLTRLKLTRDLINANRENIRFWSVLINANFQSQNKIFDLIKKVRALLLANKKIHDTEHFDRHQRENTIYGHCTFIMISMLIQLILSLSTNKGPVGLWFLPSHPEQPLLFQPHGTQILSENDLCLTLNTRNTHGECRMG